MKQELCTNRKVKLLVEAESEFYKQMFAFNKKKLKNRFLNSNVPYYNLDEFIKRVDVNCRDKNGYTPLMYHRRSPYKVQLLVIAGADINARTNSGKSILFFKQIEPPVLQYLIEKGVDLNTHYNGNTPLMGQCNNLENVKILIKAGVDVNARNRYVRKTVLFCKISTKVLKFLIENGADVNIPDYNGDTPLMYHCGSVENVKLLVEAGADINARNRYGETIFVKDLPVEVRRYLKQEKH